MKINFAYDNNRWVWSIFLMFSYPFMQKRCTILRMWTICSLSLDEFDDNSGRFRLPVQWVVVGLWWRLVLGHRQCSLIQKRVFFPRAVPVSEKGNFSPGQSLFQKRVFFPQGCAQCSHPPSLKVPWEHWGSTTDLSFLMSLFIHS